MSTTTIVELALLAGAALPLAGPGVTFVLARRARGARRWLVLALGPAVTLGLCGLAAEPVFRAGPDIAASLYILFAFVLAFYYPVLALLWLVRVHYGRHPRG